MKKTFALLSGLILVLLAGCAAHHTAQAIPSETTQAPGTAVPTPTNGNIKTPPDDEIISEEIEVEEFPLVWLPAGADLIGTRTGPGSQYPVVGLFAPGDRLVVQGRNPEKTWLEIEGVHGERAWIPAAEVEISTSLDEISLTGEITSPIPPLVDWRGETVESICLTIEESYPEDEVGPSPSISETIKCLLASMGIEVIVSGSTCQASLNVTLSGEALGHDYDFSGGEAEDIRYCYAGVQLSGEMILSAVDVEPLRVTLDEEVPLPDTITGCPASPQEAPFSSLWPRAILDGLTQLWGETVLVKALEDPQPPVRQAAALECQEAVQHPTTSAIPALILALEDPDTPARRAAAGALASLLPHNPFLSFTGGLEADYPGAQTDMADILVAELIKGLGDPDAEMRALAAQSLGILQSRAISAIPALIQALGENDPGVRASAAAALGKIGRHSETQTPELVPALILSLGDERTEVRVATAQALGEIGPGAAQAVPALSRALDDQACVVRVLMRVSPMVGRSIGPCVQIVAAEALGKIGPDAAEAVPALLQMFAALQGAADIPGESAPGETAVIALGRIGSPATEAVGFLLETLSEHPKGAIRQAAAEALAKIDPYNETVIRALIQSLEEDEVQNVRESAAIALGWIGPPAAPAIPALIQALGDVVYVQGDAAKSLAAITGEDFGTDAAAWQAWWEENQSIVADLPDISKTPSTSSTPVPPSARPSPQPTIPTASQPLTLEIGARQELSAPPPLSWYSDQIVRVTGTDVPPGGYWNPGVVVLEVLLSEIEFDPSQYEGAFPYEVEISISQQGDSITMVTFANPGGVATFNAENQYIQPLDVTLQSDSPVALGIAPLTVDVPMTLKDLSPGYYAARIFCPQHPDKHSNWVSFEIVLP